MPTHLYFNPFTLDWIFPQKRVFLTAKLNFFCYDLEFTLTLHFLHFSNILIKIPCKNVQ